MKNVDEIIEELDDYVVHFLSLDIENQPVQVRVIMTDFIDRLRKARLADKGLEDKAELLGKDAYERFASAFDCDTHKGIPVSWKGVPERNKKLMIAVCKEILRGGLL